MENNKAKKIALNDELLDKVSGGDDTEINYDPCEECTLPKINGVCFNPGCKASPFYDYRNDIVIRG